jgi:hypothetical protein
MKLQANWQHMWERERYESQSVYGAYLFWLRFFSNGKNEESTKTKNKTNALLQTLGTILNSEQG